MQKKKKNTRIRTTDRAPVDKSSPSSPCDLGNIIVRVFYLFIEGGKRPPRLLRSGIEFRGGKKKKNKNNNRQPAWKTI